MVTLNPITWLTDFYFVGVKGMHKHDFQPGEKMPITPEFTLELYKCTGCDKKTGLDDWQIRDLPSSMQYERLEA